jgi:hypothetical protein
MRYITQMAPYDGFALAIYDTQQAEIIAVFRDVDLAETIKDILNAGVLAG